MTPDDYHHVGYRLADMLALAVPQELIDPKPDAFIDIYR